MERLVRFPVNTLRGERASKLTAIDPVQTTSGVTGLDM
jgi:hypothetical protein